MGKKGAGLIKPERSFVLRLSVPISRQGTMPKEIDDFLESLRGHPLLKRDFPLIEMTDLKWSQATSNSPASAEFGVVCLPKADKAPAKPPAGVKGKPEEK